MREQVVRMIAEEGADLLTALQAIGPNDWDRPTVCAPWTIKDVLAHVVEGELAAGRVYRGEVVETGYLDPEVGIAKWRALPGEAVRASLWQHGVATQRALEAMTDDVWRREIRVMGCRTIGRLVRLHLFDLAVHGHDLTDAAGLEPVWRPRLPFLAEFVVRAAPTTLARLGVEPAGAVTVRSGELSATIDGRGGSWMLDRAGGDADATLEIALESLVLVTTGRMPVASALAGASLSGDLGMVERLLAGWQVVARG